MRIGVVSDTHGHLDLTRQAVRMLESLEVQEVLHCGDIGSVEIVPFFSKWPTHFVFGNCDPNHVELRHAIEEGGQTCHGEFGDLTIQKTRIALLHSHDQRRFRKTIQSGQWTLVCYGHTHVAAIDSYDESTVLNPGAIYRANPRSIALVELPENAATIVEF